MKKCKTIIAVVMAITMALSVFALVGCQPASEETQRDPEVQAVYEAYVAQAEEAGEDVLSYDEWLADLKASVKGEKGDKGDKGDNGTNGTNGKDGSSWRVGTTEPEATLGNEGDFYLNTETFDLYLKGAEGWSKLTNIKGTNGTNGENGEDGARGNTITNGEGAPTSTESAIEGDMYIDTQSWNVYFYNGTEWQNKNSIKGANGDNGQNGENGTNGNTWLVKDTAPTAGEGKDGDLCLNTDGWIVYYKVAGSWQELGSIKGADGKDGVGGGAEEDKGIVADVSPEAAATIDISKLSVGTHLMWAELDKPLTENTASNALYNGGRMQVKVGEGLTCELIKNAEKSGEDKNIYFGFLIKKSDEETTATLTTDLDTVKATITFEDYTSPTLKADGTSYIVPTVNSTAYNAGEGYNNTLDFAGSGMSYSKGNARVNIVITTEPWIASQIYIKIFYDTNNNQETYGPTTTNKEIKFVQSQGDPRSLCFLTGDYKPNYPFLLGGCDSVLPLIVSMTVVEA